MLPTLLALTLLPTLALAQDVVPRRLAEGVQLLTGGPDGNVLVVDGEESRLVVDGWSPARVEPLLAALERLPGPPLRFVVNTHFHEDHRGLNTPLAARGATLISHANTRASMSRGVFVQELGQSMHAAPAEALPTLVTSGDLTLHLGGRDVRLLHLPAAHTDGDLAVYIPDADVLLTGDVFELGAWPFLDVWHGGSLDGMLAACDRLAALCGERTQVIPGHGPVSDLQTLRAYREVLAGLLEKVAAASVDVPDDEQGAQQRLSDFLGRAPTAEWDQRWGGAAGGRRLAAIAWLGATGLWEPAAPVDEDRPGG